MSLPAGFWKVFGPGLMWAAAAIGVSHLVQSTRAGALAGFGMVGVILFALVLKYPFFEYGPRYAAATGRSLVEGYRRIGRWALWLYFVMTLVTAVIHQVAILLLLAFLIQFTLGVGAPVWVIGGSVYVACALLLAAGRFRGLDLVIKVVVAALAVSTLVAAAIAAPRADLSTLSISPLAATALPLGFILALVGFMPAAGRHVRHELALDARQGPGSRAALERGDGDSRLQDRLCGYGGPRFRVSHARCGGHARIRRDVQ